MDTAPHQGILARAYHWIAGERDPVDEQLKELGRQGAFMARVAHFCAFLLLILFSLGSLVALSGEALDATIHQWNAGGGFNVPKGISVAVSTLLVTCFDIGMLYAASQVRLLRLRRADPGAMRLHQFVMAFVSALEASTYMYMAYRYDNPGTVIAWVLITGRAVTSPLLAVYLSMARLLPVTPRDILAQTEITTGRGVLKDTVALANDPNASLLEKAEIFNAAAVMAPEDRERLGQLIEVVARRQPALPSTEVTVIPAAPSRRLPELQPATNGASEYLGSDYVEHSPVAVNGNGHGHTNGNGRYSSRAEGVGTVVASATAYGNGYPTAGSSALQAAALPVEEPDEDERPEREEDRGGHDVALPQARSRRADAAARAAKATPDGERAAYPRLVRPKLKRPKHAHWTRGLSVDDRMAWTNAVLQTGVDILAQRPEMREATNRELAEAMAELMMDRHRSDDGVSPAMAKRARDEYSALVNDNMAIATQAHIDGQHLAGVPDVTALPFTHEIANEVDLESLEEAARGETRVFATRRPEDAAREAMGDLLEDED